jgi:hypothetical protein
LQDEVLPPPSAPIGAQAGTPLEPLPRRQAKPDGQPVVEQSSAWHLLSAPQLPFVQSEGLVQAVPPPGPFGSVNRQRWSLVHVYPLGQSSFVLHVHALHAPE